MKKRKEEDLPESIFNKNQPDKKRSKLVLPTPQITDKELEDVCFFCFFFSFNFGQILKTKYF